MTPTPVLASMSPAVLVEGASAVLSGTDFAATPAGNVVTIDGVAATVTAATTTQLTISVPTFACLPQRTVSVQVSVGGKSSNALTRSIEPDGFLDLDVGKMTLIEDPEDFCLQFPPAAAGAGAYVVGIGAAAEQPDDLLEVSLTGVTGQTAPAPSASPVVPAPSRGGPARGGIWSIPRTEPESVALWRRQVGAESRMRRWDRDFFDQLRLGGMRLGTGATRIGHPRAANKIPAVGDSMTFKVPDTHATSLEALCMPTTITTVVRAVGARGIFVTDVENPQAGALTDSEIQALSDAFDSYIYDPDTEYFGTPTDLDQNGRIIVIFTIELNRAAGGDAGGLAWIGNFFDPTDCAASNLGEIYYSGVPDPDNVAGTKARARADVVDYLPQVIAHEFTHLLQFSVRLRAGGPPLSTWESEGQAMLAREIVGHRATGLSTGQDYGPGTVLSPVGEPWYHGLFLSLATYYGYDGTGERRPDTPETCTLLMDNLLTMNGCAPGSGYGASWSFLRFLADRYGPTWPGGEPGFMRDWVGRHPTLAGIENVEALLGRPFTEVFAEWAAMHYVDGRVSGTDPALLMSSWNVSDIMPAISENAPLLPVSRSFGNASASLSIRGGSTAYSRLSDDTPRPAVAIRVRAADGGILGTSMKPHLWVVRTR